MHGGRSETSLVSSAAHKPRSFSVSLPQIFEARSLSHSREGLRGFGTVKKDDARNRQREAEKEKAAS